MTGSSGRRIPTSSKVFVVEFTAERYRLQAEASAELTARWEELERIERRLTKFVDGPGSDDRS